MADPSLVADILCLPRNLSWPLSQLFGAAGPAGPRLPRVTLKPGRGRGEGASGNLRRLLTDGGKEGFRLGLMNSGEDRFPADEGEALSLSLSFWI